MVLPFIIGGLGVAIGAMVGACTAHAAGAKDREAAKYHRTIANELSSNYSQLEKRYQELEQQSQKQILDLTLINARSEMEKDALRLALRLQSHIIRLMQDIQLVPTTQALRELQQAANCINPVLLQLREEPIRFSYAYYFKVYQQALMLERSSESLNLPDGVSITNL
jgi:plasmid segregation protein ParM